MKYAFLQIVFDTEKRITKGEQVLRCSVIGKKNRKARERVECLRSDRAQWSVQCNFPEDGKVRKPDLRRKTTPTERSKGTVGVESWVLQTSYFLPNVYFSIKTGKTNRNTKSIRRGTRTRRRLNA